VRQVVVHLLAVTQQQEARIAALEARVSQNSSNSDRPPSSDPPFVKQPSPSTRKGTPGAKPAHPGHRQALLVPIEIITVKPEACGCGQREFPDSAPY
jgi:transposase